jgi:hypothetical protein
MEHASLAAAVEKATHASNADPAPAIAEGLAFFWPAGCRGGTTER